jgi:hypothetical protein
VRPPNSELKSEARKRAAWGTQQGGPARCLLPPGFSHGYTELFPTESFRKKLGLKERKEMDKKENVSQCEPKASFLAVYPTKYCVCDESLNLQTRM